MLAAVGELMTKVAGRAADGILCHAFTTEAYLRERTVPALLAARGTLAGFELSLPPFVVLGSDEAARSAAETAVRAQIAFYGSTPAYKPVLELHGWGSLADRLNELSRQHAWAEMGTLISDDVLSTFAVAGRPEQVAAELHRRFAGLVTRMSLDMPYAPEEEQVTATVAALRALG
jgi:probable F420-dependent oxidoreductase